MTFLKIDAEAFTTERKVVEEELRSRENSPYGTLDEDVFAAVFKKYPYRWRLPEGFGIQLILGMLAILCLPRQFHVAIVEFRETADLRVARWIFPLYLIIFAAMVVPGQRSGGVASGQNRLPKSFQTSPVHVRLRSAPKPPRRLSMT